MLDNSDTAYRAKRQRFDAETATLIVADDRDVEVSLDALKRDAMTMSSIPLGGLADLDVIVVVASGDPNLAVKEIVDAGTNQARVRYVDLREFGPSLAAAVKSNLERVEYALRPERLAHIDWDTVRPLGLWPDDEDPDVIPSGFLALGDALRWRFPSFAVSCGGYGSGKSSLAQFLALRAMLTREGIERDLQVSIAAYEDEARDLRDRIWKHIVSDVRKEEQPDEFRRRACLFQDVVMRRLHWIQPMRLNDTDGLKAYIDNVARLCDRGVELHLLDPWNGHQPDLDPGEREHQYVRRITNDLFRLSKEKSAVIHLVAHVTKEATSRTGRFTPIRLRDASGSGDFANRADVGLAIGRTSHLAKVLKGEVHDKDLPEKEVDAARRLQHPGADQHTILFIDKIKIEGVMGRARQVFALVYNRDRFDFEIDPAATRLLQNLYYA